MRADGESRRPRDCRKSPGSVKEDVVAAALIRSFDTENAFALVLDDSYGLVCFAGKVHL